MYNLIALFFAILSVAMLVLAGYALVLQSALGFVLSLTGFVIMMGVSFITKAILRKKMNDAYEKTN